MSWIAQFLTISQAIALVWTMKISDKMIQKFVKSIFNELKKQGLVEFKQKEDQVLRRAVELVAADFARERQLDEEVNKMMDDLERQNPGSFQRYKMFPLLKKRLAQEKGIVL